MNERYRKDFLQAGAIAKQVRAFGKSLIIKGASYNNVITQVNAKIKELGAIPAFPPQIALNHVAAHYLPNCNEDIIFSDEVIKLDVGICWNGAIGDCAVTIDLSEKNQKLVDAVEAALLAAEQIVKVGLPVREIGKIIEQTIVTRGFQPVRNLAGHGLGYYKIHTAPQIPNYDCQTSAIIKPGMTFAIEPFATTGKGFIYEEGQPTIFALLKNTLMKTEITRALLAKIRTFNGLPFAIHDLLGIGVELSDVEQGLDQLLQAGVVGGYPPLLEVEHGLVAQAENSVLVDKNGNVTITTR